MSQKELAERRVELAKKELKLAEQALANTQSPYIELAEVLHDMLCHDDHVEICGWEYNSWFDFKSSSTRGRYHTLGKQVADDLKMQPGELTFILETLIKRHRE